MELSACTCGAAKNMGTIARVAIFRKPKIDVERIWSLTCFVKARVGSDDEFI